MSASAAMKLFEKAISLDEAQQMEFASKIDIIIDTFPPKFISTEFYPFLTTWIPKNNLKIVRILADKVNKMISVNESLVAFAPVLETILASENQEISKRIKTNLKSVTLGGDALGFFKKLVSSPIDYVRAFCAQILFLLQPIEEKVVICQSLICDPAFKVRFALASIIATLPVDLANNVAKAFCSDSSSRIKAFLPVVCAPLPFFFTSVVPALISDHDWYIRASIAKEVSRAKDIATAINVAYPLTEDSVWQVVLSALTSFTQIIKENPNVPFENGQRMLDNLFRTLLYPQASTKNASIDAFFALNARYQFDSANIMNFVEEVITRQPPTTRLHFLQQLCALRLESIIALITDKIHAVVVSLMSSEQWRIRLGVVCALSSLATLNRDPNVRTKFSELCLQSLDDESTPVRTAAAEELLQCYRASNPSQLFPECYFTLKSSDSFRKRQAALIILSNIGKACQPAEVAQVKAEMQSFLNDKCDNVVNMANKFISELP
ncbi:hypothetical protein TVAG_040860 [Trichomonas vaginalis G3]|uniref:HEAT repeat family protein n=1 Tax=Trichomonas vaginalis (strain ATCC PRA-98 / G3) TaxID=412133 RepID=A2EWP8_TRIV3|nr:meiotic spindle elongation [Trichomonas vaginalis G3]EAY02936.1 hypothetical protein TVAG_040860 [Trichomonas vaginalis G3]KAI5521786.1 meiotic spindle elongation [Trichomonas vaginalis G3]|eukprot:XP_001315159.1 hypothetical protein [Trichomonas vaginalis G3]